MKNKYRKNYLQLVEYIRFELGKDAQNHSQQLHVAIQAYKVTNIAFPTRFTVSKSVSGFSLDG